MVKHWQLDFLVLNCYFTVHLSYSNAVLCYYLGFILLFTVLAVM